MDYVTLPLGDEGSNHSASAPPAEDDIIPPAAQQYAPRPPASAPQTVYPFSGYGGAAGGELPHFDVEVSEPHKQGNGYQAFICYKVPSINLRPL